MAADTRSITITLKLDDSLLGSDSTQEQSSATNTEKASNKNNNNSSIKALAANAVMQASQAATSELLGWAEYFWNKELALKDDYIGQRNKQIALTQINRGVSYASQLGFGVSSGFAAAGPIGAAIGGAIALATSIANIARSNIEGQMNQDLTIRQLNTQLEFTRSRAGWSISAASIGEDL